jgi:hypothetical protein
VNGSLVERGLVGQNICSLQGNRGNDYRRYYQIADITICVEADLEITDQTFHRKFDSFAVADPGSDVITLRHHFSLPDVCEQDLGQKVYDQLPWAIYRSADAWTYLGILPHGHPGFHRVAFFDRSYTNGSIYSPGPESFREGHQTSLTLFPTDQLFLASALANRRGCYLHAGGVILDGCGLLFVGHSEAGKSTMVSMLRDTSEILCDDRIIVRKRQGTFRAYGTWSHGDVPDVSGASAPLRAILFLEQAAENCLVPLRDSRDIGRRLLAHLIRPLVTAEWWEETLDLVEDMTHIPCFVLRFDQSGRAVDLLGTHFGL